MAAFSAKQRFGRVLTASLPLLFVLLLAWLLIGPLWSQSGLPNSADGNLHLHRSAAVARSWSAGVLWPRWFPDVYQGLGAPTFHYYSPLFYILMAPLHLLGLSLDLSAKLVITGSFIASGLAAWAWLRRLLGPIAGLAGAALYLSQAHLFREYYFQGDYPQLLALFLLPVVFWAFTRLYLDDDWLGRLAAPLSLALLIISHNITAMLGAVVLALYSLALLLWRRVPLAWLRVVLGVVLGLGLGAFFMLPALADAGLVRIQNLQEGFFHFGQYFVPWRELLAAPPVFDGRAANPPFPHLLGWAAWLVVAAGVFFLIISFLRRSDGAAARFWAGVGLVLVGLCVALTQPWSTWLWNNLPLLALVEFPSRWLGLASLGVALCGGAVVAGWREGWSWGLLLGLILVVALTSSVFLYPHQPFRAIDAYSSIRTQTYEQRSNAWGLTSGNEFLPRWAASPRAEAGQQAQDQYLPPGAEWSWETPHRAVLRSAEGSMLPAGALVLPVHYFPAWEAMADGALASIEPTAEGLVGLTLAKPADEIVLRWQGTTWQKAGTWITLITLVGYVVWIGLALRRGAGRKRSPAPGPISPWYAWLAPLVLLVLLILARDTVRLMGLGWFQRSSPLGEVTGVANPAHIELGGEEQPGVILLGWELLSSSPEPGSQVILRLYWQRGEKIPEDMHSFAFLYTPSLKRSWAGVQNHNPGRIPTSNWSKRLYYVDELAIPLPSDLPPVTYTLAVGMVDARGERLAVPDNPDDLVFLDEIQVAPLEAGRRQRMQPEVDAPAHFGTSLRLQGYDLLPEPGGPILRLYWEVVQVPPANLVTFVHLVNEDDQLAAQFDGPPLEGLLSTDQWPVGSLMVDRRKLVLPDDLPGGQYRLLVGLYERGTDRRLAVEPEPGVEGYSAEALIVPFYVPPGQE